MMNIGERIKNLRKEKGLSVDYIAEKLGKNRATIYRYESSEIENLPYPILVPLADILGTTPMYLMGCEVENIKVTLEEKQLLENFNKLNNLGKKEANKRVIELGYMPMYCSDENDEFTKAQKKSFEARRKSEQYFKEHPEQMPIASHDKKGNFTEEDYKHDDDLMMDDNIWND